MKVLLIRLITLIQTPVVVTRNCRLVVYLLRSLLPCEAVWNILRRRFFSRAQFSRYLDFVPMLFLYRFFRSGSLIQKRPSEYTLVDTRYLLLVLHFQSFLLSAEACEFLLSLPLQNLFG